MCKEFFEVIKVGLVVVVMGVMGCCIGVFVLSLGMLLGDVMLYIVKKCKLKRGVLGIVVIRGS